MEHIVGFPEDDLKQIGLLEKEKDSVFVKQFQKGVMKGEIPLVNLVHFMLNLIGLTEFPFIGKPMVSASTGLPKEAFCETIQERKRLLPFWIGSGLSVQQIFLPID